MSLCSPSSTQADVESFVRPQLRDIEIIIGARLELAEQEPDGNGVTDAEKETLLQMQQILYSTEVRSLSPSSSSTAASASSARADPLTVRPQEGFEVPEDAQEELVNEEEEETF